MSLLRFSLSTPIHHLSRSTSLQRRYLHDAVDTTRTATTTTRRREDDSWSGIWAPTDEWQRPRALKDGEFVDHIIMTVSAGKGGNGCVAFYRPSTPRAPRNPYRLGPPSGGNGGRGGDVYLLPDDSLTSLASVPRKVKGKPGSGGSGDWRNGKNGEDRVVRVPLGTVVRVIGWGNRGVYPSDGRGGEVDKGGSWVHYPGWAEANMKREEFIEAEKWLEREQRRRMMEGKKKWAPLITEGREIDLDGELKGLVDTDTADEPLGKKRREWLGYLVAAGGAGGFGNPHFGANLSTGNSSPPPRFATRGVLGEVLTLSLELRTNADVALVGRCNVGKSTLIRALTGGRVKSDVGGWEGVTRGVVRGVVRVAQREGERRVWEGELGDTRLFDESMEEDSGRRRLQVEGDEFSPVPTKPGHAFDLYESFRFTITDNPGFVQELAPITQTILRSIERAKVLVYVVDLSGDTPWDDLRDVMAEVARGGEGKSRDALVVANKADLLVGSEGAEEEEQVANARAKVRELEEYVQREMGVVEVVPVSAKWGMNLGRVLMSLEVLLKTRSKCSLYNSTHT